MDFKHVSVLLNETIESLQIKPGGIYVDGTLGGGGHASGICSRLSDKGRLIGIDQDIEALEAAKKRLMEFKDRFTPVRSNFSQIETILRDLKIEKVEGIILDLGVSSYQIDNPERGFSYMKDAFLDMRMDTRKGLTAADVINHYSESELFRIIRDYGEERFAGNIAKRICMARKQTPIETTSALCKVIGSAIPKRFQQHGHPAKKTFQAIRIEVNEELKILEESIDIMIECLNPTGRLCVITFHSLEDRIVKNKFRENANPCICPSDFPICVCNKQSKGKVITAKPILPTKKEMEHNKRAKSAKLRIFERC